MAYGAVPYSGHAAGLLRGYPVEGVGFFGAIWVAEALPDVS